MLRRLRQQGGGACDADLEAMPAEGKKRCLELGGGAAAPTTASTVPLSGVGLVRAARVVPLLRAHPFKILKLCALVVYAVPYLVRRCRSWPRLAITACWRGAWHCSDRPRVVMDRKLVNIFREQS